MCSWTVGSRAEPSSVRFETWGGTAAMTRRLIFCAVPVFQIGTFELSGTGLLRPVIGESIPRILEVFWTVSRTCKGIVRVFKWIYTYIIYIYIYLYSHDDRIIITCWLPGRVADRAVLHIIMSTRRESWMNVVPEFSVRK